VIVVSYLAGLLVTLGEAASVAGLQLAVQLLIASSLPLHLGDAALRAILVLAGGLWQAALVVVSWAFLPGGRERSSVAAVYRALSAYAGEHAGMPSGIAAEPPTADFGTDALNDPNPLLRSPDRERLTLLLAGAGRIRISLAALASYGSRCCLMDAAAQALSGIADALDARRGYRQRAAALHEAVAAIDLPQDVPWRWAAAALLGQLRAATRLTGQLGDPGEAPGQVASGPAGQPRPWWRPGVIPALPILRASAGSSTEAGRHALRMAAVAGTSEIVAQAFGLPHGYWVALTAVIVLRPDYASTIYRCGQRAIGTVIGVGLGVATALLLHAGAAALVVGTGVTMTIAYAVIAVNYLLYVVFLTDFAVTLLALLGQAAEQTAAARLAATGIGAALAVIGYLAWPSWEGEAAQRKLALLYETQGRYATLVLRGYVRPGCVDPAQLRSAQVAARRARLAAEASADRLADEPPRPPVTAQAAYALTDTARRLAQASHILDAAITAAPGGPDGKSTAAAAATRDALGQFADGVEAAAEAIAGALRDLRPPESLPPLRALQTALYNGLTDAGNGLAGPARVLISVSDEYTDALDSAADILRQA
jgi:uncharacterized membrane protein YccC